MIGLYIHVPFCKKRCSYCNFYSTTYGKEERDAFIRVLIKELRHRCEQLSFSTLYVGGGTPSQLDEEQMETLFAVLHQYCLPTAEITFEANPDDITLQKARHWVRLGINRISLGIQSFDDHKLILMNRRHNASQARKAIYILRDAGINNISVDLIYGLPQQTLSEWEVELNEVFKLPIQHLSAYSLIYEPGTVLYHERMQGNVEECEEERSLQMFTMLNQRIKLEGFERYEIANYARSGYRSKHNSSYWKSKPYVGLGPGAHSFDGVRTRRHNLPSLSLYLGSFSDSSVFQDVPHELENLTEEELYNEVVMTRLRTIEGLPLAQITSSQQAYLLRMARPHLQRRLLELTPEECLRFTDNGIFLSDGIVSDLMMV